MDTLILEKMSDVDIMESIHELQTSNDIFYINIMESKKNNNDEMIYIYHKSFTEKILEIFKKILNAIMEFFKKVKISIDTKIQQIKLNNKLEELKDLLAKKRSKALNKNFDYFDIKKYKKYYSDYINAYTKELKKGLNKDFKNVKEYEKWRQDMIASLSDFNYKLSDEEQWKLSISIENAVKLTIEEANNRDKNLKMVHDHGSLAIRQLEDHYKKANGPNSLVNYDDNKLKIFKLKTGLIGFICGKLFQMIKTVVHVITKHTFACITALIVALIAL